MSIIPLAYIDPGSGTILLQMLIASSLGGICLFWKRIKRLFGFGRKDEENDSRQPPSGDASGKAP